MTDDPTSSLTLREQVVEAIRLNRELVEHLSLGFTPKAHDLKRLTRSEKNDPELVSDNAVRHQAAAVLDSDMFARQLFEKVDRFCTSIESAMEEIADNR
ncbi:hypothetical protein Pan189_42460 [Stratiformator vulcanicus]|uniref:HEPN domain protein n=2 Tax=Stratiformator vulcanicus TaxID=2527980 RepID=A0A517R7H0_9PLAN|nr:hypothetical protein Pan189_42460 [Stratiformator vulcanicus]